MSAYPRLTRTSIRDLPIDVYLGDPLQDLGMAAIPNLYLRFYRHLRSDGQFIDAGEAMTLVHIMAQDGPMRAGSTQLAHLSSLREKGLAFTLRSQEGRPQVWEVRSLFFNLEQVAREWMTHQQPLLVQWQREGRTEPRPNYTFPSGYAHEIVLPDEVCADILDGRIQPVPDKWLQHAQERFSNGG